MISAEEFARAHRQMSAEEWSPIPAVIIDYTADAEIATVVPLIKQIYHDSSTHDLPQIYGVPIRSPRTAFAGLTLPVSVGDKVLLIFTMRSLDNLMESDLSGLDVPDQVDPEDNKFKDYNFCVGIAGFNDESNAIGTDQSLMLINNWNKEQENKIRLEESGAIVITNENNKITLSSDGQILITTSGQINMKANDTNLFGNVNVDIGASGIAGPTSTVVFINGIATSIT